MANLNVFIQPEYALNPSPPIVCVGNTSFLSTNMTAPLGFTWTVSPVIPNFPVIGPNNINIVWANTGIYTVCVYPNNPNYFCNDTICTTITVTDIPPVDSISGEKLVCPLLPYSYTANSSLTNVQFDWVVVGGNLSTFTGNPIVVIWNNTGPYSISVKQTDLASPYCMSSSITCQVTAKTLNGPLTLSTGPLCTNSTQMYTISPPQDPNTVFNWTISASNRGSVVGGQGTATVTIQWNNIPGPVTINCIATLCNNTLPLNVNLNLNNAIPANITQTGTLCPGGSVTLNAGVGPYSGALWSPSASGSTITVTNTGSYIVTTTDLNGCKSTDSYVLNGVPGPVASISTSNVEQFCVLPVVPPGFGNVTYTALTNPNYTYQWYCNNTLQIGQTNSTFMHPTTNVPGIFNYQVKVMDSSTGCMSFSNIRTVIQQDCTGGNGNGGCVPAAHTVTITSTPNVPLCNKINFNVLAVNATPLSWNFGDPSGTINNPGPIGAMFTYSQAGNYLATLTYNVPNLAGNGTCQLTKTHAVSIPVAADFDYAFTNNCREVKFIDFSTFLPGVNITNWNWNYGDGNMVNTAVAGFMPLHTYALAGTYNVTLTVTTSSGCQVQITIPVSVLGPVVVPYTIMPNPACVGDPVMFNHTVNPQILSYFWTFGDGSNNGGTNPKHSYLLSGNPYLTSLMTTDIYNCTNTISVNLVINPAFMPDTIVHTPLKICFGDSVKLTAPPAATYVWNTIPVQNTQIIYVKTPGWYAVTVTNTDGCSAVPDSVQVNVCPLPPALISGPHIICDSGCVQLNASLGYLFTYQWYNENNVLLAAQTDSILQVCSNALEDSVYVVITNANGCKDSSAIWDIMIAVSPNVNITIVGDSCAGNPNLLTSGPLLPNVVYSWSTGATGPTIIAIQAGSYTVYAKDTLTGCIGTATAIIDPLPDLCIMPSGCYKACDPDTLCGPPGMAMYQWNFNGIPIVGATSQCLIVSQNGSYSLTATNNFGCMATSDTLILILIPCCHPSDTEVTALPADPLMEDCCWNISYTNSQDSLMGVIIYTNDADLNLTAGTLSPLLNVVGFTSNSITLNSATVGSPMPMGALINFMKICLTKITSNPQVIYFDWLSTDGSHLCRDSLVLDCEIMGECVFIENDSIYCSPSGGWVYEIVVCNSSDNNFSFGYLDFAEISPFGALLIPSFINLGGNPILPGSCDTFSFILNGPNLENQNFCFNVIAHEDNPIVDPSVRCCSLDTIHCIFVPGCSPCDSTYVAGIIPNEQDSCCYTLSLANYHDNNTYLGIQICSLTPGSTVSLNNFIGSGWTTSNLTPTGFILEYDAGFIPIGTQSIPEFCISNATNPYNEVVVKWLGFGIDSYITLCSDTISLLCPGDCGYYEEPFDIICNDDGSYHIELFFHNTRPDTVYSATISSYIPQDPTLGTFDLYVTFTGGLPPGGSYGPIVFNITTVAGAGDSICMVTTLHNSEKIFLKLVANLKLCLYCLIVTIMTNLVNVMKNLKSK
ncbi:MAG: PKD domain-containing protein [Saprospiraceae bacterium]|nr:PKD domain-containing protein [Saprospiraceae bacterium]